MLSDQLKSAGVSREIIGEILGHSHGSITLDRYGKPFSPAILNAELQKVFFKIPVDVLEVTSQKIIRWQRMPE